MEWLCFKNRFYQGHYNPILPKIYLTLLIWNDEEGTGEGQGLLSGVFILDSNNGIKLLLLSDNIYKN